jgi:hypothetical protein
MIKRFENLIQHQLKRGFVLPALFSILYIIVTTGFLSQIGHRWSGINTDPDYIHLFNTLNVVNGYAPGNIDNPASTLHLFSALIFKLTYFFRNLLSSHASLPNDVLKHPDFYLNVCSLVYIALISACIFGFVKTALTRNNHTESLLVIGSLFLMTPLFTNATEFSAQPILIIAGLILLLAIYKIWFCKIAATNLQAGIIGFCLALGFFSKFTFLHLFPIVFFLGFNKRQYLLMITSFISFALLFGYRLAGEEQRIFQWLLGNFTRTGVYGSNPNFWPDANVYFANVIFFVKGNIIFCVALSLVLWRFCRKPELIKSQSPVAALLILQLVFIAFMAKHRTSSYYFIADFVLLPVFVAFILEEFRLNGRLFSSRPILRYSLITGVVVFFLSLVYFRTQRFDRNRAANIQLFKQLEEEQIHNGTESGTMVAASFYGNWNSGFMYTKELEDVFGYQLFPSFNSDSMMEFSGRKVRSLMAGEKVLIHDYDLNPHVESSYVITKRLTNYMEIRKK